jgi:hypothetical protein
MSVKQQVYRAGSTEDLLNEAACLGDNRWVSTVDVRPGSIAVPRTEDAAVAKSAISAKAAVPCVLQLLRAASGPKLEMIGYQVRITLFSGRLAPRLDSSVGATNGLNAPCDRCSHPGTRKQFNSPQFTHLSTLARKPDEAASRRSHCRHRLTMPAAHLLRWIERRERAPDRAHESFGL